MTKGESGEHTNGFKEVPDNDGKQCKDDNSSNAIDTRAVNQGKEGRWNNVTSHDKSGWYHLGKQRQEYSGGKERNHHPKPEADFRAILSLLGGRHAPQLYQVAFAAGALDMRRKL